MSGEWILSTVLQSARYFQIHSRLVWTILDFWLSAVTWECIASRPRINSNRFQDRVNLTVHDTEIILKNKAKQLLKNKQITHNYPQKKQHTSQYDIGLRFEDMPICQQLLSISNTLLEVSWSRIHPQDSADSEVSCPKSPEVKKYPVGCAGF